MSRAIEAAYRESGALRRLVARVLDLRDRDGTFPRTLSYDPPPGDAEALRSLLPPVALRQSARGLRVHLGRLAQVLEDEARDRGEPAPSLEALLDRVAGRAPRSRREEASALREEILRAVETGFREGRARAVAAGVAPGEIVDRLEERHVSEAARCVGELAGLARGSGVDVARETAARLAAGVAVAHGRGGARLDDLSRWISGHTKALRPDAPDHARLADALLALDPELRARVDAQAPGSSALRRRLAYEALGITGNDATLDVLVQGVVEVEIRGERLDDAGKLARHGLPCRISLSALRAATRVTSPAADVLCVENETAFHHFAARKAAGLIVSTEGQAGWAVVELLRALAASGPRMFAHAGDLDRSGLLILRSLRRRTGLPIAPRFMDAATYDASLAHGLPLDRDERDALQRLRAEWSEPDGHDLLERMIDERRWIEQEAVLEVLG